MVQSEVKSLIRNILFNRDFCQRFYKDLTSTLYSDRTVALLWHKYLPRGVENIATEWHDFCKRILVWVNSIQSSYTNVAQKKDE